MSLATPSAGWGSPGTAGRAAAAQPGQSMRRGSTGHAAHAPGAGRRAAQSPSGNARVVHQVASHRPAVAAATVRLVITSAPPTRGSDLQLTTPASTHLRHVLKHEVGHAVALPAARLLHAVEAHALPRGDASRGAVDQHLGRRRGQAGGRGGGAGGGGQGSSQAAVGVTGGGLHQCSGQWLGPRGSPAGAFASPGSRAAAPSCCAHLLRHLPRGPLVRRAALEDAAGWAHLQAQGQAAPVTRPAARSVHRRRRQGQQGRQAASVGAQPAPQAASSGLHSRQRRARKPAPSPPPFAVAAKVVAPHKFHPQGMTGID